MRSLQFVLPLLLSGCLAVCHGKAVKIHGYVTSVTSPTQFEIEDFKITRDQNLTLELDKTDVEEQTDFRPEDISVGTELQIKGDYDAQSGELKASEVKVFLRDNRKIKREALVDVKTTLESAGDGGWKGVIRADGQHIRVDESTQMTVRRNKSERKVAKRKHSGDQSGEESAQSTPFRGDEISPEFFVKYEGRRQRDGTILAQKVELRRGELEVGEERLWRSMSPKVKPSNYIEARPGDLIIRGVGRYKLVPNEKVQEYAQQLGQSLTPTFQKSLIPGDRNRIPFQLYVVQNITPNAFALPNGTVLINSGLFDVVENEAQLAFVLSHEFAHATEKHQWRGQEFQKKKRIAIEIGGAVAAAAGKYNVSNALRMVDGAIRNGYQRYLENQADRVGMEYMTEAGYDARQAPRVWKIMTQKLGDHHTNFFWSDHDNHTMRRSYLMAELKNNYTDVKFDGLKMDSEEFESVKALVGRGESTNKRLKMRLNKVTSATGETVIEEKAPPLTRAATLPNMQVHLPSAPQAPAPNTMQVSAPPATPVHTLVNGLADVAFTSSPPGALVSFSGMRTCHTPCVLKLEARRFTVTMTMSGYADWTSEITVEPGKAVVAELQRVAASQP